MPVAPYGTPKYRAWNRDRMRRRRKSPGAVRRELDLASIHRADRTISRLTDQEVL